MTVQQFTDYVKKMKHYEEALNVIYWDMRTGAPKKRISTTLRGSWNIISLLI